jgi:hypothetical protein
MCISSIGVLAFKQVDEIEPNRTEFLTIPAAMAQMRLAAKCTGSAAGFVDNVAGCVKGSLLPI